MSSDTKALINKKLEELQKVHRLLDEDSKSQSCWKLDELCEHQPNKLTQIGQVLHDADLTQPKDWYLKIRKNLLEREIDESSHRMWEERTAPDMHLNWSESI